MLTSRAVYQKAGILIHVVPDDVMATILYESFVTGPKGPDFSGNSSFIAVGSGFFVCIFSIGVSGARHMI